MDISPLIYFIKERESIRKKKELGLFEPWTNDNILQTYRFCNVRRRHDRVSQWLIKHVLTEANLNLNTKSFLMFSAFCRWCNWPPTIKEIMDAGLYPAKDIDWDGVIKVMEARSKRGEKLWTGAYMIKSSKPWKGQPKYVGIINEAIIRGIGPITEEIFDTIVKTNLKRDVWLLVQQRKEWGSFLAGQYVDDLTWTPLLVYAKDIYTWAPQGPGSIRGFNRLLGLPLNTRHKEDRWCEQLQYWRQCVIDELGKEFEDLTLHDLQNCLCETDKMIRTKNGEGRPRSIYRSETAY